MPRSHRSRRSALTAGALLLSIVGLMAGPLAGPAHADTAGGPCTTTSSPTVPGPTPLDGICEYLEGRQGVVQVALFDNDTGGSYGLSTGEAKQYTASIVKVDILARWLRKLQRRGAIPGDVRYSLRYLMQNMIEHSDNVAATSLFFFGGGCEALTRFNKLIPLKDTKVACESPTYYGWGNTTTTAADQVDLIKVLAYDRPRRVLRDDARSYGLELMQSIEPDQRWGVTCGPWGKSCDPPDHAQPVPGVTVALKNGWKTLPTCSLPIPQCPWQVNSVGWVKGQGRDYVLAVLTTEDPVGTGDDFGFKYGIDTIQNVSARVWDNLPSTGATRACLDAQAAHRKAKKRLSRAKRKLKRANAGEKKSRINRARARKRSTKKKQRSAKRAVREACRAPQP